MGLYELISFALRHQLLKRHSLKSSGAALNFEEEFCLLLVATW
jgi:hypothetical protein